MDGCTTSSSRSATGWALPLLAAGILPAWSPCCALRAAHGTSCCVVSDRLFRRRGQRPESVFQLCHSDGAVSVFRGRAPCDALRETRCAGGESAAVLLVVLPSALSVVRFDQIVSQTDNRVVVARWFDRTRARRRQRADERIDVRLCAVHARHGYKAWVWDRAARSFVTDLDRRPAWGSPTGFWCRTRRCPSETQPAVGGVSEERLRPGAELSGVLADDWHVFDQQDVFFTPFAGFGGVERPGPNFSLYKRSPSAP